MRAESVGGRGAGLGRHAGHPGQQRGRRRGEAGAAGGAGAHRQGRRVRRRRRAGRGDRGCRGERRRTSDRCWWRSMSAPAAAASRRGRDAVALAQRIAGVAAICASAGCRPITAAPSTSARWRSGARRSGRGRGLPPHRGAVATSRGWTARSSAVRGPARSSSNRSPACIRKCRRAATSSWMRTTRVTWTRRARRSAPSGTRCSCWRR